MTEFKSGFAKKMNDMLEFRIARGYKTETHESNLRQFDKFCAKNYPDASNLTAEIVYNWLDTLSAKSRYTANTLASTIRQFGLYLSAFDENAFVLTEHFCSNSNRNIPYNFTDEEITALFTAIDMIKADESEPHLNIIAPVLYRLTYTCGLRPNEVRELLHSNVDLKSGVVTIVNTKMKKDRIVIMSDDMLKMCRKYDRKRAIFAGDNPYFFPSESGGAFKSDRLYSVLNRAWTEAVCSEDCPLPPKIRLYDLRHRFASARLNIWLDEKKDLMAMLPYLREYMGHSSLDETAYYIHLLPENLLKSAGIDWNRFNNMFPEADV